MRLYFLSSLPCLLRVGGAVFGRTGTFEKFAEIELQDDLFAEFIPQNAAPVCVRLNENLLFSPPHGTEIYLFKQGAAIFVRDFPPVDFSFRLLAQKRTQSALSTLFSQGVVTLSIESEKGLFCFSFPELCPENMSDCRIEEKNGCIFLIFPSFLFAAATDGKERMRRRYKKIEETADGFRLIFPSACVKGSVYTQTYRVREGEISLLSTRRSEGEREENNLTFDFFERVLYRADFSSLLSSDLREKAETLPSFLGDFIDWTVLSSPRSIGLIYKKRERVFEVVDCAASVENNEIVDITF